MHKLMQHSDSVKFKDDSKIPKNFPFPTRTVHLPAWLASKTNRSSDDFNRSRHPLKCGPCPHTNETGNYSRAPASIHTFPPALQKRKNTPTTLYNSECRTSCRTVSWVGCVSHKNRTASCGPRMVCELTCTQLTSTIMRL